jgi:hypothetical protein
VEPAGAARGEHWWPVALAIVATVVLHVALPAKYRVNPAFVFPEMQHTDYAPVTWVPTFADYLSLAFWTATAFSPTDVSAIKRWAKLLMVLESMVSLGLGALVIARAINILK